MWINNYPEMISESYEELLKQEKRLRGSPLESRIKMLRLLKSGAYPVASFNLPRCLATAEPAVGTLVDHLPTRWSRCFARIPQTQRQIRAHH